MSEIPECPYCGARVPTDRVMDYDSRVKLRCKNCGGFFEFMPGFGAFSLPEEERMVSTRTEGSIPERYYEFPQPETAWDTERPPVQSGSSGAACFVILCLCFFIPIIMFILMIVMGFGFLWF